MSPRTSTATERKCTDCDVAKPVADFNKKGIGWDGVQKYQSYCKLCENKRRWARAKRQPDRSEKMRPVYQRYDEKNREKRAAFSQEWRDRPGVRQKEADRHLERKYGLTRAEWQTMLDAQNGNCAICQNEMQKICVDHDHETGAVRALLCQTCNSLLGNARDNVNVLRSAERYLIRYKELADG